MYAALTNLIDKLDRLDAKKTNIIKWGCPVPSFGDLSRSKVASLGLNPSNKEFVNNNGEELNGVNRRFPTLNSLKLKKWSDVDASHLIEISQACRDYFIGNPYDRWFKKLDEIVSGANASFYSSTNCACHLDLIPFATVQKWTNLTPAQKKNLINTTGDILGLLLRDSPVSILILNGRSVVKYFEEISAISLDSLLMPEWSLGRSIDGGVKGIAYFGSTSHVGNIDLGRTILILGYNHNIQSSFGVTKNVVQNIRIWVANKTKEII